jgi:hypothetical protein
MNAKRKKATHRGRRRVQGSKIPTGFREYGEPRPPGWASPVRNIGNRGRLLKFFPPFRNKQNGNFAGPPLNFAQTADKILGDKRLLANNPGLKQKLESFELCNSNPAIKHPCWNKRELPPELLQETLAQSAEWTIQKFQTVQRALARLYAVAWCGRGPESADAKKQLEKLIPAGKSHPLTKYIPEIAEKFRELRGWILKSDELMQTEFPREIDRVKALAELYDESTGIISEALRFSEKSFLTNRLADTLRIPPPTIRKSLSS